MPNEPLAIDDAELHLTIVRKIAAQSGLAQPLGLGREPQAQP